MLCWATRENTAFLTEEHVTETRARLSLPQLIEAKRAGPSNAVAQQGGGDQRHHGRLGGLQAECGALIEGVHGVAEQEGD